MTTLLNDLPTWLVGLIVIGGCTGFAVGLLLVLRDKVKSSMREMHNEVAGYIFAGIAVLYALLLGFVVFASWEHVGAADTDVQTEAAAVTTLYQSTRGLPAAMRQQAQAELRRYTNLVITVGWPALAHGEASPSVDASLDRLYRIFDRGTSRGVPDPLETESLQLLDQITTARAERLADAHGFLTGPLWAVILLGGACTLAFALLFYLENAGIQIAMVALLAVLISSMLFLLIILDHPFSGGYTVSPEPLRIALEQMQAGP
jgi:hypothetical protein